MKIKNIPMRTYEQRWECECGGGDMEVFETSTTKPGLFYQHKCNRCGRIEGLSNEYYPRILLSTDKENE